MKIIDNFLPKNLLTEIQDRVFSQHFPWYWRNHLVEDTDHYWFNHCFYNNNKVLSPHYEDWIIPILSKLKFEGNLMEARCNMMIKKNKSYTSRLHVDNEEKNGKTAILYLNTCNGGTAFKIKNIQKKYYSKENRLILFDSSTLHRGFSQTDVERRVIININYSS